MNNKDQLIHGQKILFITQCFPCGSWVCIEKIAERLSHKKSSVIVLGLGIPSENKSELKYILIPFFAYTKYGNITCASPILGFLWMLPLYFSAVSYSLFNNPKTIIYNGLTLGLVLSPFFKLIGKKNIIMYHSIIGDVGRTTKNILKVLFRSVDLVVVNSTGMRDDLSEVVDKNKLVVNEHYADKIFFDSPKKRAKSHASLKILYAGRIDEDKRCFPLIEFAKNMKDNPNFEFTFVGAGSAVGTVSELHHEYKYIKYGGYIDDKKKLAKLYSEADVLWGFGDTTYLCLPAVEALACDTPIIVPKYAAIANKDEIINESLVPSSIGWLVDPFDQEDIEKVLSRIRRNKEYLGKKCREYARRVYSSSNLLRTVKIIERKIGG
jgi:glycosyltransferase involved in cell wall biosynthesis